MTDGAPTGRLSGEDVLALRFAAHRQLARWAKLPRLSPDQHARRTALKRAVAVLHDPALAHGCDLDAHDTGTQR
jgi:hypothetical protein